MTVMQLPLGPESTATICPACRAHVKTRVVYETSAQTHMCAGILCLMGCWCCCCIPYCKDTFQNGNHYCPNCNAYLGTYKT